MLNWRIQTNALIETGPAKLNLCVALEVAKAQR
jgi:hypothetical protein